VLPSQIVNGEVHSTPAPQHGSPSLPHAPAWQPPPVHTPWVAPQLAAAATQRLFVWLQQPPLAQRTPSQQG